MTTLSSSTNAVMVFRLRGRCEPRRGQKSFENRNPAKARAPGRRELINEGLESPNELPMPSHGFCQHGRLWTTCPECGKEVIKAAATKRRDSDEFLEQPRPVKKAVKPPPEEPPEEPAAPAED